MLGIFPEGPRSKNSPSFDTFIFFKAAREASKEQVKLKELMGEFNDTKEEEQPMRKRPRTMGLKRALEKK